MRRVDTTQRCRHRVDCYASEHDSSCPSQLTGRPLLELAREVEKLREECSGQRERVGRLERYVLALGAVAVVLAAAQFEWL